MLVLEARVFGSLRFSLEGEGIESLQGCARLGSSPTVASPGCRVTTSHNVADRIVSL